MSSAKRSLSLCAWACNEETIIETFVRKTVADLARVSDDYELIVVDDGSTDRTLERLRALQTEFPVLQVTTHGRNLGYGDCFRTTIGMATRDILLWNTVDMFHDTADLPRLLEPLDRFDLVQGVRTDLAANPWRSQLTTIVNYWLIRTLFQLPMSEFQNVKVLKRSVMDRIQLKAASGFVNAEIGIKAFYLGARIKEVEVTFHPRQGGESKGARPAVLWQTLTDILALWCQCVVLRRLPRGAVRYPVETLPQRRWSTREFLRGRSL
jgi:glycosyltransferase involved in cell wall biosynthesis